MTGRRKNCQVQTDKRTTSRFFTDYFFCVARSASLFVVFSVALFVSGCGYFDHTKTNPCAGNLLTCTPDDQKAFCCAHLDSNECSSISFDVTTCADGGESAVTGGDQAPEAAGGVGDGSGTDVQGGGNGNAVTSGGSGGNGAGLGAGGNKGPTGAGGGTAVAGNGGATRAYGGDAKSGGQGGSSEAPNTSCSSNADCGSQYCDTAQGKCVVCLPDNSGCSGDTPVCKSGGENVCVRCLLPGTGCSPTKPICQPGPGGDDTLNLCVECNGPENQCNGRACDTANNRCVDCIVDSNDVSIGCSDSKPVCNVADDASQNRCVACTTKSQGTRCKGNTPICGGNNECRGCQAHSECDDAGGVCKWETGECLSENAVIHVGQTSPSCGTTNAGGKAKPLCNLQTAVDRAGGTKTTILVNPGKYIESIQIKNKGSSIWIVGKDGANISTDTKDQGNVYIEGDSKVTLEHLGIVNAPGAGVGIKCVATTVTPMLTVRGCTITGNTGGGVSLGSCGFNMTSNVIAANGSGTSTFGGIWITSAGNNAILLNNTVANNVLQSGTEGVAGIWCSASCGSVDVRNTISYKNQKGDLSQNLTPQFSCIYDGTNVTSGTSNLKSDDCALDADYSLKKTDPKPPCIDAADPKTQYEFKYNVDVKGNNRVQNGRADIGAYEAG